MQLTKNERGYYEGHAGDLRVFLSQLFLVKGQTGTMRDYVMTWLLIARPKGTNNAFICKAFHPTEEPDAEEKSLKEAQELTEEQVRSLYDEMNRTYLLHQSSETITNKAPEKTPRLPVTS